MKTVNELTSMSDQKGAELLVKTWNDSLAAQLLIKEGMQIEKMPDGLHIRCNQQAAPKVIFSLAGAGIEVYELINQSRQSLEKAFMMLAGDSGD